MLKGMKEAPAGMPDDKLMEEMARQNGIDPENFDYDEWLANQDLEVHDPNSDG